jgi:MFS transporter, UMF1 family
VREFLSRKPVLSWALYDWANSAFATTVMAGFFPTFFKQFWSVGADPTESTVRLGIANGVAGFIVAILAPMLGAIADKGGRRKQFLLAWTLVGALATGAMFFVGRGEWQLAALLFVLATMGFSGAIVFYDSMLLDVARPEELDRVSAFGFAAGYLGGGVLFLLNVLMTLKPAWFGLADAGEAVRWSFMTVAVWWLLFSIPLLRNVRPTYAAAPLPAAAAIRSGFAELADTVRHVSRYRSIVLFLIAYWFYIDAVNTIIKMAVDYGLTLGLPVAGLLTALLLTQFVAFPAALVFGYLGDRIGAKRGILLGLAVYCAVTIYAYFLDTTAEFYAMAVVVGLVQGGVQSLSRSLFGQLVPPGKNAEFFGFYNMMGKFATVLGPLLVALVAGVTGDARASILSLLLLFAVGIVLLLRVPRLTPAGGIEREKVR